MISGGARTAIDGREARPLGAGVDAALAALSAWFPAVEAGEVLCEMSSVATNAQMIFAMAAAGVFESRTGSSGHRRNARELLDAMWHQQRADGSFSKYPGGPPSSLASIQAFVAAKLVGPPPVESVAGGADSHRARLNRLARYINGTRALWRAPLAVPVYLLFGLVPEAWPSSFAQFRTRLVGAVADRVLRWCVAEDARLPWWKHVAVPLLYQLASGRRCELRDEQVPREIGLRRGRQRPRQPPRSASRAHVRAWLDARTNADDGTLFDCTAITVFGVAARRALDPGDAAGLNARALETLQRWQTDVVAGGRVVGKWQSASDTAVGDAYAFLWLLTDAGLAGGRLAEDVARFVLRRQAPNGGFGFSKGNRLNPDMDDTGSAVWGLGRWIAERDAMPADLPREVVVAACRRGLDFLVRHQNADHGWGTWDKDNFPLVSRLNRTRVVDARSVLEHTARVLLAFEMFADDPIFGEAHERAFRSGLRWLLGRQLRDGSFEGAWFVAYGFGTAMALAVLGLGARRSTPEASACAAAIERALTWLLPKQNADGGFGESPRSYAQSTYVSAPSNPTQTGMVVTLLLTFLRNERCRHYHIVAPVAERAIAYLLATQESNGLWLDGNRHVFTGVVFPDVEYVRYPFIQEVACANALALWRQLGPTPRTRQRRPRADERNPHAVRVYRGGRIERAARRLLLRDLYDQGDERGWKTSSADAAESELDPISRDAVNRLDADALRNQQELVLARVRCGDLRARADGRGAPDGARDELQSAEAIVRQLERIESELPRREVERARLPVFIARFAVLERRYGTARAARLGRRIYYNLGYWPLISGAPPLSTARIDQTALPHGPYAPVVRDGYLGNMRTLDGTLVDVGHVMCGADFHLNRVAIPKHYFELTRRLRLRNPFDVHAATLTGDLTSATLNLHLATGDPRHRYTSWALLARQALLFENNSDLRGDLDALNLVARYAADPSGPLAPLLASYYGHSGGPAPYLTRAAELAARSPFFFAARAGRSEVVRVDPRTPEYAHSLDGKVLEIVRYTSKFRFKASEHGWRVVALLVDAFADWLNREIEGSNGQDDEARPADFPVWLDR